METRAEAIASGLDSMVFVEIPQQELTEPLKYRRWLLELEEKWMTEHNHVPHYYASGGWESESGVCGDFGHGFEHCKLYRWDGTHPKYSDDDFRAKRGLLLRDHYSPHDVIKVHAIVDNLCAYLKQSGLVHTRINFKKP